MSTPHVLILRAPGINRDADAAHAIELAGGAPALIHVNRLAEGSVRLADYAMLVIPGGFSYGDHLGAGRLLAVDLAHRFVDALRAFVAAGKPVIGICNGFQVLVKAGILPGWGENVEQPPIAVTLTDNASAQFECRWVQLSADPASPCIFTRGIARPFEVPVAHGEGRIAVAGSNDLAALEAHHLIALRYLAGADGTAYPANPNGSPHGIAGICNPQGNVLGLMPHPENAVRPQQHPRWTREPRRSEGEGLIIFRNAVNYASQL
jgi:phosphoribosylformylglycinamidine synthase subunit PurQ / glutaminase